VSDREGPKRPSVGVVGLGLIGGSIGLALRSPNRLVLGCDVHPSAEKIALDRFCVDRIAPFEEVCACDVVFLGVPPSCMVEVAAQVMSLAPLETVVSDCSSVKAEIARWSASKQFKNFIPGHPMAGHEKSGGAYASAWLFRGARWILTPHTGTSRTALKVIESYISEMGATPLRLNPEEHDRHVALLSHLPHVLAGALVLQAKGMNHLEVGAGSWRDVTRVGGVDPKLWAQILHGNREELVRVLHEFQDSLQKFGSILEDESERAVEGWLEEAQRAKKDQTPPPAAATPRKRKI
jgi:prephenate dehydrogenase